MEKDNAVVFMLNSLDGIYTGEKLITPDKINKMLMCRSCQGKNGVTVTSALIEGDFYNLCQTCSEKLCSMCSYKSNFKKISFFPLYNQ
jgi:hypothetical protein